MRCTWTAFTLVEFLCASFNREPPKPKQIKMIHKRALGFTVLSLLMPCVLLGLPAGCKTKPPTAAAMQRLQGTWEGVLVGQEKDGKITITITGNSLRYQGTGTNEMVEATFTLPAETNPQQLRATITAAQNPVGAVDIGQVVIAFFKFEDGTLTLAGEPRNGLKPFEEPTMFHFKVRKVQPQKKNTALPTSK
jgi:uncharacterized protein (TIGR03067 family)